LRLAVGPTDDFFASVLLFVWPLFKSSTKTYPCASADASPAAAPSSGSSPPQLPTLPEPSSPRGGSVSLLPSSRVRRLGEAESRFRVRPPWTRATSGLSGDSGTGGCGSADRGPDATRSRISGRGARARTPGR